MGEKDDGKDYRKDHGDGVSCVSASSEDDDDSEVEVEFTTIARFAKIDPH